ncbi:RINT1-like protein MAG2L isoform X1 [Ananas comosus]|uniref:RINT1-like protein MAG2L isoform X1 n=1 Tax=Ananas comosus TaxID=4615 RepID=A0A6P5GL89_ANACO|nr:RINT1-like protein MAG2L isoform X1 [Ananas comosus]
MAEPPKWSAPDAVSRRLLGFLDEHFKSHGDLHKAPSLAAQLSRECADRERGLRLLEEKLSRASSAWLARSNEVRAILRRVGHLAEGSFPRRSRGADVGEGDVELGQLPLLAKEIGRIETVRLYAETTLQLEALVGDLEDAAFAVVSQTPKTNTSLSLRRASNLNDIMWKQEKLLLAIKIMKDIEHVLVRVSKSRPRWANLVKAVDSRVEKTLAILRPQALNDHRALLAALGWPPPLLTSDIEGDRSSEMLNPLFLMHGEKKEMYSQNFLALCALQHLQAQREARHYMDFTKQSCYRDDLWAIDELVHPVSLKMEYHFSKWSDQPKFVFALVYKVTKDFMDGVDSVLQPLIDQARLVGLSAKEAWVTAMVKILLAYLERRVFPVLVSTYHNSDENLEVSSSWLDLLDLIITFDKRMQVLSSSGIKLTGPFLELEGFSRSLSILSVFNEHSDWLQIWAEIELKIANDNLEPELEDERSWLCRIGKQSEFGYKEEVDIFLLSTREDYKAPPIADSVIKVALAMIERGQTLPSKRMRSQFARSSATIFLNNFFVILLQRCRDLELMTAAIQDEALLRVACTVNASRYCESVIREWDEEVTFLEMTGDGNNNQQHPRLFFADEIGYLIKLETDCLEEIMSVLLLEFDAQCWDYIRNIDQWEKELSEPKVPVMDEYNLGISPGFVQALDMLRDHIEKLKLYLNSKDFLDLWRSIAEGLDYFVFSSIPWSDVKFSRSGVYQFKADMRALFHVFRPLCVRPEAFFPLISNSLKLLTITPKDVDYFLRVLVTDERRKKEWLLQQELHHLTINQAESILRNRKFGE